MKNLFKILVLLFIVVSASVKTKAQTPITICPDQTSFSSMTRGYYFTAPTTFTICGLFVEDDRSTSAQSVEIVRFTAGPPPAYAAVTNSFVSLFYQNNYVPNSMVAVPNITINAGDVIGIYGSRATVNSYGASQCPVTIGGFPVTLFRSGMQFDLATQQMHDIWNENNYYIGRVTMFTDCCPTPIAIAGITGPATVCEGNTVTYTVPAQTGAVSYDWTVPTGATINSGQGSTSVSVTWNTATPPDSVCVTWTDACSTSTPTCLGITVNPNPTTTVPSNITSCNGSSIPATTFASTPIGATFAWTNSNAAIGLAANGTGNTPIFNATNTTGAPITATINVTSTLNGCTGIASSYTITVNPSPTATLPSNITACSGTSIPATNFTSNPVGATYAWTNSNTAVGLIANGTGNVPTFNATNTTGAPITGTITVTPTLNGCIGVATTYDITVNPTPAAPTVANIAICPNNSATLTATAPGGNYDWYDAATGGNLLASGNSYTTPTLIANATYYVETSINGCVSPRTTVTVSISPNITVNAGVDDSICFGGNYPLQVSPNGIGYTYIWDEATNPAFSTLFNPTVSPVSTTTYMVTVTDPNGCSGADTLTISVDPQLSLNMGVTNVTCNAACDGGVTVTASGGTTPYQYIWTSGGTNPSLTNLCPNLYTVTVTDPFGCIITGDTTVTEPTAISISITSSTDPLCNGDCNGSIVASATGGAGTLQYSIDGVNFQASGTFNNLCAGNYIITTQDINLCQNTAQVSLIDPQLITINNITSIDVTCNGGANGNINISANGGAGSLTYSIDNGATFLSTSNFIGLSAGSYTIIVKDINGCFVNGGIIDIQEPLALSIPNTITDVGCFGGNDGWISVSPQGGTSPYTFLWSNGTTLPLASNLAAGNYTVTVTDANGCFLDSTFTVNQPNAINFVTFNADTLNGCVPLAINFNNTTDPNLIGSSLWNFGDGATSTTNSPSHVYSSPGMYDVLLTITDTGGCVGSHTEFSYINVSDLPTADFTMDPPTSTMFDPTINFYDQSYFNIVNWNWNFGGTGTSSDQNPTYTFPTDTGNYLITLTVENAAGCTNSTTGILTITGEYGIYLPNAFTPDGNGQNDFFGPKGFGITNENYSFKIYNRWGEEIFESHDLSLGWNGTFNDKLVPNDVYVWSISFTDINGETHQQLGKVSIIK